MATTQERAAELRRQAAELEAGDPADSRALIQSLVESLTMLTLRLNRLEERLDALETRRP